MRGRPGTHALPLAGGGRAVGGPIPLGLLGVLFGIALAAWTAAAAVLVAAASPLAAHEPLAWQPVLATHLVALGVLPFAVTGAAFHLLPVMLRNDVNRPRLLRVAPVPLAGAFLVAPGLALDRPALLWPGAALVAVGLALVLAETLGLVRRAPGDRTLVVSRTGVALTALHVSAALLLGAVVYAHGDASFGGVDHERWLLVHLHLAILGWLALLIVTVGRTLVPMLAQAPAAPPRRVPVAELSLTAGVWLLLAGLAAGSRPLAAAGGALALATLAAFARLLVRAARTKHAAVEAPLVHLLAGAVFLLEAAALGFAMLAGAVSVRRGVEAYVLLLLLGWAAGVTIGHLGKLLSLSLWVWWPPGPRPKQAELYPRALWLGEAAAFAVGVEVLAAGTLAGSAALARAGAAVLVVAALAAVAGAWRTWTRRARRAQA